ncbi:dTDP-4-amino-4,6-dideoxygalactose transaminase [Sphingomonas sp. SORGH_AS870]|uniref:DegT/DnrJ/EryC1/StrS family aminotransferase n=1 Tax=Sphingomonas sp. SORGH_AS_0870 TaxID=3041801 RepID=UPI00285B558D|nr:DegT/DnrJ/EryC1/StrS family aminotransferase [Sphingomonas sp. SORGH_AS_0870]MDR6144905.1 dTDP-4-amino-4,6-dideoxygalactose transaminase [Sphingomonas sp. SORGH_AS_0870]
MVIRSGANDVGCWRAEQDERRMDFPLIAPRPPRLSEHLDGLKRIEASGQFSNNGPEVRALEAEMVDRLFDGRGAALAVGNATLGLMIAIRQAAGMTPKPGMLAMMPAMTFAATAQAAIWAGLTPLIVDVDPQGWTADPGEEERMLARHGDRIGAIVPYATFGTDIDLDRYAWLARRHGVGVVVDAAASLGTLDERGQGFGTGAPFTLVYSMHATKTFSVGEGGLVYSGDGDRIDQLRAMVNFGFERGRVATLPGINAKMPEILALMARTKLAEIDAVCAARADLDREYRDSLPGYGFQAERGRRQATQFMPVLLPPAIAARRDAVIAALAADGVGAGHYFSPHLGEQPLFRDTALIQPTPVADALSARMLSLPITDGMKSGDAGTVAERLKAVVARIAAEGAPAPDRDRPCGCLVVGGGPAGTAILIAASKTGQLVPLARQGLVLVERSDRIGAGELGGYAIRSDTTAETFLSAVKGNPHPELAALEAHPAGQVMAGYCGALGAPLRDTAPLLEATAQRLRGIVTDHGGAVLTATEAVRADRMADGGWRTTLNGPDGVRTLTSRHIVIATGGYQTDEQIADAMVAGARLGDMAGDRLMRSDTLLRHGGIDRARERLAGVRAPRVAIIGASTSAIACAVQLLKCHDLPFGAEAITLLARTPPKPFFPTVEAAHAEGFTDFTQDDICPVSGFVLRLAGLRLESRELVLRMLALGGRTPDPRLALHRIAGEADLHARAIIGAADLVIGALGYRPRALPLFDADGVAIALAHEEGRPMVDRHCHILDAQDRPVPGAYGIGLSAGFVPWGPLGGENSFRGQANGLWLWQNDVGRMIVDQVLGQGDAQSGAAAA